ncbi:MAG TPA: alcohol dehydrogenase, partial [Firmicutes bacterium]|nr:alcohol dehydrogenase [Bacillota bacterium]
MKIPEGISFDQAILITTAGTAFYAFDQAGGYIAGDTVAVVGPGPIGLCLVAAAKALGAEKVVLVGTRASRL